MRRLRRILFFLLFGAVVNILVAWACARWGDRPGMPIECAGSPVTRVPTRAISIVDNPDFVSRGKEWNVASGLDERRSSTKWCTHVRYSRWWIEPVQGLRQSLESERFGIPFRAMELDYHTQREIGSAGEWRSQRVEGWRGGWPWSSTELGRSPGDIEQLPFVWPLAILPLGFTLNTFFYAALLFLPFATFTTLRRRRRIRRNLCFSCGYSLAGAVPTNNTITCPECGSTTRE